MQKRQMDLQTEALQQKKMQQELSNAGRAPVGETRLTLLTAV